MRDDTLLAHAGRHPVEDHGAINPPVYRASTIAFRSVAALEAAHKEPFARNTLVYGRYGTPTTFAIEEAIAELEGGHRAIAVSSGLAAIAAALTALTKPGDHILVADSVYGPTRRVCDAALQEAGVRITYYDPLIGAGIAELIQPNTSVIYLESPGSLTFEVQDVGAIAAVARGRGIRTIIDNTWATPYFFKAFEHGVDVSLHAATKYIGGHSDLLLGLIVTNQETYPQVRGRVATLGYSASADDCYLALRGLRTLGVRLRRHEQSALAVAQWLAARPEVQRVLHPALSSCPGHELWRRDYRGASGLFSVILQPAPRERAVALLESLRLFPMGYSWGGYESLALLIDPSPVRTAKPWEQPAPMVRLHIGLEDPDDLIADLAGGLAAFS